MAAHDARVLHTSLSPDGQTVATCAADENLKFWKVFENRKRPGVAAGKEGGSLDSDRPDEDDKNNNDDDDQGYSGGDKKTASRRKDSKYSSIESTLAQTMRSMSIR